MPYTGAVRSSNTAARYIQFTRAPHAACAARRRTWKLIAEQPEVKRNGLEVPEVLAGAPYHNA